MRFAFGLLLVPLWIDFASAAAPPLKPNEEIVKTRDGCGVVLQSDKKYIENYRKFYSELGWGGACVDGLIMGEGVFGPRQIRHDGVYQEETRGWAWYGRSFGWGEMRHSNGAVLRSFGWEGKGVYYQSLDPAVVTWSTATAMGSNISDGDTAVWTDAVSFQVTVAKEGKSESFRCPTPGSYAGCDAVWTAHAAPVIERIKAFIAMHEPKVEKRRKEAEAIAAKWRQQIGPEEVANRAALAQRINALATLQGENHKRCWDTDRSIEAEYLESYAKSRSPKQEADREEKLGRAYQELWSKPECATHSYAMHGLEKADMYFGRAAKSRGLQEEWDRRSSERMAKMFGAIAEGVTTFQNTQNALQQQASPNSNGALAVAQAVTQAYASQPREIEVTRLTFGGTASRTSCLRESIEPGVERPQLQPGKAVPIDYIEVSGRGSSRWLDWEMYVLENTCDETIVAYGAACLDTVSQLNYGGGSDTGPYLANQQVGARGILASGHGLRRGQKLILAFRGRDPAQTNIEFSTYHPHVRHIAKVAWGALELDTWGRNAVPEIQAWKDDVHLALNRVEGGPPRSSLGGKAGQWPAQWKGGSCQQMSMGRP